jgi:class 3 adenylate cyclase
MFLNRLSIQSKLILALLLVSLASILVVSYIGYTSARDAMQRSAMNQLEGQQIQRGTLVKNLLNNIKNIAITLADSRITVEGMREFRDAFHKLDSARLTPGEEGKLKDFYLKVYFPALTPAIDGEPSLEQYWPASAAGRYLQYHYIATNPHVYEHRQDLAAAGDGSAYSEAHRKFHGQFARVARLFGFTDVHLIDAETLDIVYTYQKTAEFGTNLETGPYADSHLGELARALDKHRDRGSFKFADFEPFLPNRGTPQAFIGTPIFDGPRMIGILAFQFPMDEIVRVMTGNYKWREEGLGETGEVYLVGPDFTMRSRARKMVENPAAFLASLREAGVSEQIVQQIERQKNVLLTLPVKTPTVEKALQGKRGIEAILNYRQVPVLSAYGPLELDSLRWAVIAEMEQSEALQPVNAFTRKVLATATGLTLLTALLALLLAHYLLRPIRQLTEGARRVGTGAGGVRVHVDSQDEFRELAQAFNDMTGSLDTKTEQLEQKVRENEELLLNILPAPVAARLREGDGQANQSFADVTVLFADIQGFEDLPAAVGPDDSLGLLQDLVIAFDEAAEKARVEKVKTIGSSYLAVCGLSVQRPDHTNRMIEFALELVRIVRRFNQERNTRLAVDIGINAGPVVGGIVGRSKFIYDLWGDTVTIARSLNSDGVTAIQVTETVYERLHDLHAFSRPGEVDVKGKGRVRTWCLDA